MEFECAKNCGLLKRPSNIMASIKSAASFNANTEVPFPPQEADDLVQQVNKDVWRTVEVPNYEEVNPYHHFKALDSSDPRRYNIHFRDGLRLLSEVQPRKEYQADCNFCHSPYGSYLYESHAERLQPEDYDALLDSGWLRIGQFLEQPICEKSCCPSIPIRLDVTQFQAAKRHKQVLSRMQAYMDGRRPILKTKREPATGPTTAHRGLTNTGACCGTRRKRTNNRGELLQTIHLTLRSALELLGRARTSVSDYCPSELHNEDVIIDSIVQGLQLWHENSDEVIHKMNEKSYCSHTPAEIRKQHEYLVSSPVPLQLAQAIVRLDKDIFIDNHFLSTLRLAMAETLCNWINVNAVCARVFQCSVSSPGYLNFALRKGHNGSLEHANAVASDVYPEVFRQFRAVTGPEVPAMPLDENARNTFSSDSEGSEPRQFYGSDCSRSASGVQSCLSDNPQMYNYTKLQNDHFSKYGDGYKHTFAVRLTRPYFTDAHLELYVRFNTEVHDMDEEQDWKRFFMLHLVNSPLVFRPAINPQGNAAGDTASSSVSCNRPSQTKGFRRGRYRCSARYLRHHLQWKGRDMIWDDWEQYLSFTPAHLIHLLTYMRHRRSVTCSHSSLNKINDCLSMPPSYRPRRREGVRWTHGMERTSTFNLLYRLFADNEWRSPPMRHPPGDFDSDDKPLERFLCLRARYLQFLEESCPSVLPSAAYVTSVLQEAWDSVYVPDSLQLPSFEELVQACEDVSHGIRKMEIGIAAHKKLSNYHKNIVRTNCIKQNDYADGRAMLDKYLARDCHGNERNAETDGWDLRMGYGTFFHEYWLDGFLVCVSVLDILPTRVASVYCFYNPDLRHMEWGKYTALTEIYWAQKAAEHSPILRYVDMNHYVHRCGKMNYKRSYCPSELKCPYSLKWVPMDEALPRLDADVHASLYPEGKYLKEQTLAQYEQLAPELIPSLCLRELNSFRKTRRLQLSLPCSAVFNRSFYISWDGLSSAYRETLFHAIVEWVQRVGPELAKRILVDPSYLIAQRGLSTDRKSINEEGSTGRRLRKVTMFLRAFKRTRSNN
eukprot:gb/GECG01015043.1/.p1 GENE.gb/GECG01015043.1/~~gb/GECG01015043.1/.p1  ORF type:complete len:1055 (+),score=78.30 gb/GECG01015043.1/:1-3165(+)